MNNHSKCARQRGGQARAVLSIATDRDILEARNRGREMARDLGFPRGDLVLISTAISELARNIVVHAGGGEIALAVVRSGNQRGMVISATDQGPGIANIALAMQEGYSTSGGLGLGLPGVRRLMDEFHIESWLGKGTMVTVTKWKRGNEASASIMDESLSGGGRVIPFPPLAARTAPAPL